MVSSRGRMVKSAISRTSIGETASRPVTAISMISPMIEVIGPICGSTPGGNCSRTSDSRSATCWRLRIDVGAPVELDIDDRQADAETRAHARDARHAVHLRLERIGDELLDLLRREPLGLGHDRDGRAVEIGEDVDRQARAAREGAIERPARQRSASTNRRLRSDWRDEEGEHRGVPQRIWLRSSAPCGDDALAGLDPRDDQHALAVERFDAHFARHEAFGVGVLVDDRLAIGAAQHAVARHGDAASLVGGRGQHRQKLTGAQAGRVALDAEVDGDRLVAVGEACAAVAAASTVRSSASTAGRVIPDRIGLVAQRFDPEPCGIDDLEDDGVGLGDLPSDGLDAAMTPETGATSFSWSRMPRSRFARRMRRPDSSRSASSIWARAITP